MFAKVLLASFIYDMTDIFCFSDKRIQNFFCIVCFVLFVLFALFCIVCFFSYVYKKCFVYLLLMDTDSASLQFIFVSQKKCSALEEDARRLMFEIAIGSKIFECLGRSHE